MIERNESAQFFGRKDEARWRSLLGRHVSYQRRWSAAGYSARDAAHILHDCKFCRSVSAMWHARRFNHVHMPRWGGRDRNPARRGGHGRLIRRLSRWSCFNTPALCYHNLRVNKSVLASCLGNNALLLTIPSPMASLPDKEVKGRAGIYLGVSLQHLISLKERDVSTSHVDRWLPSCWKTRR